MTFQLLSPVGTTKFFMQELLSRDGRIMAFKYIQFGSFILFQLQNNFFLLFLLHFHWYFNLNFNPTQQIMNVSGATVCNSTKFYRTGATLHLEMFFSCIFSFSVPNFCDSAGSFECHSCLNVASQQHQLFCTFANNFTFYSFLCNSEREEEKFVGFSLSISHTISVQSTESRKDPNLCFCLLNMSITAH